MKIVFDTENPEELQILLEAVHKLADLAKARAVSASIDGANRIESLELTVRSENCLKAGGIYSVTELCGRTADELEKTPNLGRKSLAEIRLALSLRGLKLRGD